MKIDKLDLLKKGWTTKEIEHASQVIERAENQKHIGIKFLDKSTFWAMLFLLVIINVICTAFFVPFLFAINNITLYFIIAVIGLVFGILFTVLIADIEHLDHTHHRTLVGTFLVSGIINFGLLVRLAGDFSKQSGLSLLHDPYISGTVYLIAFLIPYAIFLARNSVQQ